MVWYSHLFKNFPVFNVLSHIMLELILLLVWDMGVLVTQSYLFVTPMDHSPPGSFVHGILQARTPEWVSIPYSRSSQPREQTHISCIAGRLFTVWATREALGVWNRDLILLSSSTWITTRNIHFPSLICDYMSRNVSGFHLCINQLWSLSVVLVNSPLCANPSLCILQPCQT